MSMTELQQKMLEAQQQLAGKITEVQQAIAVGGANLSPEEEKLLAARLGEFNELLHQVLGAVQRFLHELG